MLCVAIGARTGVLTEARQRERRAVGVEVGTARRCVVCVVPGRRWAGPPEQKVGKECLARSKVSVRKVVFASFAKLDS